MTCPIRSPHGLESVVDCREDIDWIILDLVSKEQWVINSMMKTNKQKQQQHTDNNEEMKKKKTQALGKGGGDYKKTAATEETLVANHPRVQTRIKTKVVKA